jgi:hypothetical protein
MNGARPLTRVIMAVPCRFDPREIQAALPHAGLVCGEVVLRRVGPAMPNAPEITGSDVPCSAILVANEARSTRMPRPVPPSGMVWVRANAPAAT